MLTRPSTRPWLQASEQWFEGYSRQSTAIPLRANRARGGSGVGSTIIDAVGEEEPNARAADAWVHEHGPDQTFAAEIEILGHAGVRPLMSFTTTTTRRFSAFARTWLRTFVFPAPRSPERTVTGSGINARLPLSHGDGAAKPPEIGGVAWRASRVVPPPRRRGWTHRPCTRNRPGRRRGTRGRLRRQTAPHRARGRHPARRPVRRRPSRAESRYARSKADPARKPVPCKPGRCRSRRASEAPLPRWRRRGLGPSPYPPRPERAAYSAEEATATPRTRVNAAEPLKHRSRHRSNKAPSDRLADDLPSRHRFRYSSGGFLASSPPFFACNTNSSMHGGQQKV